LENSVENKPATPEVSNAAIRRGQIMLIIALVSMASLHLINFVEHWINCCFWYQYLIPAVIMSVAAIGYYFGFWWSRMALVIGIIWTSFTVIVELLVMSQGFAETHSWLLAGFTLFINLFILYAMFINKSTKAFTAQQSKIFDVQNHG